MAKPPPFNIQLSGESVRSPELALRQEWLETNGLGGYAMSTVLGCNTRKYHGLLVNPIPDSDIRHVLLSKVETTLVLDDIEYPLSTNQYPGTLHPCGYEYAESFELAEAPAILFRVGAVKLEITVMMRYEQPAVLLRYRIVESPAPVTLRLKPLLAYRDHNGTTAENQFACLEARNRSDAWVVEPYQGMPVVCFRLSGEASFQGRPDWFRSFEYQRELERGYDYREDLFTPGDFEVEIAEAGSTVLLASMGAPTEYPDEAWEREITRRTERPRTRLAGEHGRLDRLETDAEHFLITKSRKGVPSIIAGFPWFGEWGRDAMIALPGLTLCTGRFTDAMDVLVSYADAERDGLFPNQLSVYGESSYNTVDASLWFFWAAQQYLRHTGESTHVWDHLGPAMTRILGAYLSNRSPHGRVRDDGLLSVGSAETQLTWMDAKVNGVPVTPRHGCPVEINALWYNALHFYRELSPEALPDVLSGLPRIADNLAGAFRDLFWLEDGGYLADVVLPDSQADRAIRPNQVIAASLPHSPLREEQMKSVVRVVEEHLLTPYGLRTLSREDPRYVDRYRGNQEERDRAYHQGTVWPWPLGHFVEAFVRIYAENPDRVQELRAYLEPLFGDHIESWGLGSVSEVLEPEPPHQPGGCPMQAWSLAETIRSYRLLTTGTDLC